MMLRNKVAIITGGGRGIGRAIALAFAKAGADLAVVSRTRSELEAVASEIHNLGRCFSSSGGSTKVARRSSGRQVLVVVADVSDPIKVMRMVKATLRELGRVDILVNNAAFAAPRSVVGTSLEDWNRTLEVNLTGVFLCSQAVLAHMLEQGEGKIINISSGSGVRGSPGNAAYSASKAGVIAFTQALAGEVRETGIQVNVICPGPTRTEMLASRPTGVSPYSAADAMEPEEVAGAALFLASDYSGRINAQTFHVRISDRW